MSNLQPLSTSFFTHHPPQEKFKQSENKHPITASWTLHTSTNLRFALTTSSSIHLTENHSQYSPASDALTQTHRTHMRADPSVQCPDDHPIMTADDVTAQIDRHY